MDNYLTKPLEPARLAEMLEKWLPNREDGDGSQRSEVRGQKSEAGNQGMEGGGHEKRTASEDDAPAINMADFLRRLGGDEELTKQIIERFVDTNSDRLETLFQAIDQGDASEVRDLAHAIKGSSLNISAGDLANASGLLEQAGKDGDVAACRDLGPQMVREFERLCLELSPLGGKPR